MGVFLALPPAAPSAWVERHIGLLQPGGSVLDVACGSGRHLRWLAQRGFKVTGVDRDAAAVAPLLAQAEIIVAVHEAPGGADPPRYCLAGIEAKIRSLPQVRQDQ